MWGREALLFILLLALIFTAALGFLFPAVWIVSALVIVAAAAFLWTGMRRSPADRMDAGPPPGPRR